jgi:hypothetical protein
MIAIGDRARVNPENHGKVNHRPPAAMDETIMITMIIRIRKLAAVRTS